MQDRWIGSDDMLVVAHVFVTGLSTRSIEAIVARTLAARSVGVKFSRWSRFGLYTLATCSEIPAATVDQINWAARICDRYFWTREESRRVLGPPNGWSLGPVINRRLKSI